MKPVQGYFLIKPDDLHWRQSNLMKIPNADFLERTGSENLAARLWRLPPQERQHPPSACAPGGVLFCARRHGPHPCGRRDVDRAEIHRRVGGARPVGPGQLRQVFNDTEAEVLWLIVGAPEELEFLLGSKSQADLSLIYPVEPTQLPKELAGVAWPPNAAG